MGQLLGVRGFRRCGLNSGHNVGFDTTHDVSFTPLVVIPAGIGGRSEAGRVSGEVRLNSAKRRSTQFNQGLQQRCKRRVSDVTVSAVEMRETIDKAILQSCLDISGESAARGTAVDLVGRGEQHIREGQPWAAFTLGWLTNGFAKVFQQDKELLFFALLGAVIVRPILWVLLSGGGHFGVEVKSKLLFGCMGRANIYVIHSGTYLPDWLGAVGCFNTSQSRLTVSTSLLPLHACVKRKSKLNQSIDWQTLRNAIISPFIWDGFMPLGNST